MSPEARAGITIPSRLIKRFEERKVVLFIGAGCSQSAGFPGWRDLICALVEHFEDNGHRIRTKVAPLIDDGRFSAAAEVCQSQDRSSYIEFMREAFDRPLIPDAPHYYKQIAPLGVRLVVTTNFDSLIEEALGWNALTWKDTHDFPEYLRNDRSLVFHLHGVIHRSDTLIHTESEYREFRRDGAIARNFFQGIASQNTILFLGYGFGDPVIRWAEENLESELRLRPDWYCLCPDGTQLEKPRGVYTEMRIATYPLLQSTISGLGDAHANGVALWMSHINSAPVDRAEEWQRITNAYLSSLPARTPAECAAYYRGAVSDWAIVDQGRAAQRVICTDIIDAALSATAYCAVILGASGEGKSTALRQIGVQACRKGFEVFEAKSPDADLSRVVQGLTSAAFVLIDDAERIPNLRRHLAVLAKSGTPIKLILAARTVNWNDLDLRDDERRSIDEFPIGHITSMEANSIAELLLWSGAANRDAGSLRDSLLDASDGFLLAAMWIATHGKPLRKILEGAVSEIAVRSKSLIRLMAIVTSVESRVNRGKRPLKCTLPFLAACLSTSEFRCRLLVRSLADELRPVVDHDVVATRHPVIASLIRGILFDPASAYMSELEVLTDIVRTAIQFSKEGREFEGQLMWQIPRSFMDSADLGGPKDSDAEYKKYRELFKTATRGKPDEPLAWYWWAIAIKKRGAKPEVLRDVVERGLQHNPGDPGLLTLAQSYDGPRGAAK